MLLYAQGQCITCIDSLKPPGNSLGRAWPRPQQGDEDSGAGAACAALLPGDNQAQVHLPFFSGKEKYQTVICFLGVGEAGPVSPHLAWAGHHGVLVLGVGTPGESGSGLPPPPTAPPC